MSLDPVYTFVSCGFGTNREAMAKAKDYDPGLSRERSALHQKFSSAEATESHRSFLDSRVGRNPRDILSHTKRIIALLDQEKGDACFGALVDLNIALGTKGYDLRRSLLAQSYAILSEPQRVFLYQHLVSGLKPTENIAGNRGSLLSDQILGTTEFVKLSNHPSNLKESLLEQALDARANGDWDTARHILERQVRKDPGDVQASMELLSLYQEQDMQAAFLSTYAQLIGRQFALPELWDKLDRRFKKNSG